MDICHLELEKALSEVKTLSGLIPICATCKKIRDDKGYWNQIEAYIRNHSDAEFTHGICPEYAQKLYPGFKDRDRDLSYVRYPMSYNQSGAECHCEEPQQRSNLVGKPRRLLRR